MEQKNYKYKISVVMAIYNVEPFLREAIDSVIEQDIGFENIQLILVDDGSPDGCGAICDEYAKKYPSNILVIHKENGGVSSARNAGLDCTEGELINFLDSDDIITPTAFRNVYDFYVENREKTDIIVLPMHFFEGKTGEHTLNYKFHQGSRVIDLEEEWNVCQLSAAATFINSSLLESLRFDTRLSYAEDANLLQRVLINKRTMGVIQDSGKYMYRQRTTGVASALQTSTQKKDWYLPYLTYFQQSIVDFYLTNLGRVPRFIQFVLMYDIQWRLRMETIPEGILTGDEKEDFLCRLYGMLQYFDDEVILAQRNISSEHKVFALRKKYGSQEIQTLGNDIALRFGDTIGTTLSNCTCRWEFLNLNDNTCYLEGRIKLYEGLDKDVNIYIQLDENRYRCNRIDKIITSNSLGEPILHNCSFYVELPTDCLKNNAEVSVWINYKNCDIEIQKLQFGPFFPTSNAYRNSYAIKKDWKISINGAKILFQQISKRKILLCELRLLKELWRNNKVGERNAVIARIASFLFKLKKRRPIWLISDRATKASDNGEAFFTFVRENHPEIDAYFVICKDCPDHDRMSKIGPVLEKDSYKHKIYTLICDYIISSQGEIDVFNPFAGYSEAYRGKIHSGKFIFLQHGVTQNDLSNWCNKYNKNITGFITSANREYQSILDGNYFYSEAELWLTGFPRFDRLYSAPEKIITIMPTWRRYLFGECSRITKVWSLGANFLNSDFYLFFNGLINHPLLLEKAKELGYKIAFFPHPNIQEHIDLFEKNENVIFFEKNMEYRDVYAKSNMVITDYSSAVFDYAYLRRPLIYTQFDKDDFYSGAHTLSKGYFEYERDGFGEITYDLDSTVNLIIEYMENDCQLKQKYRDRIDNFFAYNDKNNCQRVYDKIIELESTK